MHYLKCTKCAVVSLQYGVHVHDKRPNIEQCYPLHPHGQNLIKCDPFSLTRVGASH